MYKKLGFTIVELMIVIIAIAILSGIVIVGYGAIQRDARDAKVRDGAAKVAEAAEMMFAKSEVTIRDTHSNWGSESGFDYVNGVAVCKDADKNANGSGFIGKGSYACTLDDVLVTNGYLPNDFISSLPLNTKYSVSSRGRYTLMTYPCSTAAKANMYALFFSLEAPTQKDTENYNSVVSRCGTGSTLRTSYNMQGAMLIDMNK